MRLLATLYYCYTQKPNEYDRQQKLIKDQEYVMSKIRYYQDQRKTNEETNFPVFLIYLSYPDNIQFYYMHIL